MTNLAFNDPDLRWTETLVEITYQLWEYKLVRYIKVSGNTRGASILRDAIEIDAEGLYQQFGGDLEAVELVMEREPVPGESDNTLTAEAREAGDLEEWLSDMCTGVRIVERVKEGRPFHNGAIATEELARG